MEKWQAQGRPQAVDLLRRHTRQLLDRLSAPDDHADIVDQGEAFIESPGLADSDG
jgi:hypothetical protein